MPSLFLEYLNARMFVAMIRKNGAGHYFEAHKQKSTATWVLCVASGFSSLTNIPTTWLFPNFVCAKSGMRTLFCLRQRASEVGFLSATQKKHRYCGASCGGEKGIRTLETVLGFTRFPVVRLRPTRPSLHGLLHYSR